MKKFDYNKDDFVSIFGYVLQNPRWSVKFVYQYLLIRKSKLFDGKFYCSQFKISGNIKRPIFHYIYYSYRTYADPCPAFSTEFYVFQKTYIHEVVQSSRISPLFHYLRYGSKERLNPNPEFNTEYYLATNPDVETSGFHPLYHYINWGKKEGRSMAATGTVLQEQSTRGKLKKIKVNIKNRKMYSYNHWLKKHIPNKKNLKFQREYIFRYQPLISIILPVYKPSLYMLKEAIASVRNQTYGNWQLCISDCSVDNSIIKLLNQYKEQDPRIEVVFHNKQLNIPANSNEALKLVTGEFTGLMDHDDLLTPNALFEVVNYINTDRDVDVIYSDEDKVSENTKIFFDPFFKPDWSPDTFMSIMYTCHFTVYRRSIIKKVKDFREGFNGAQDYDLMLRVTEKTDKIAHISQILYHWREHKESIAHGMDAKKYAIESLKKAKLEALERRGLKGSLRESKRFPGQFCVDYEVSGQPGVTIIIPTKNNRKLLEKCVNSILNNTKYGNYDILIVNNQSDEKDTLNYLGSVNNKNIKVLGYDKPFNFSAINNFAAEYARGEYLLFLNDDIEIVEQDWLEKMLGFAQLKHIGAVGVQLLFPESGTIQHCGIINLDEGPGHAFYNFPSNSVYHFGRNEVDYNWLAVTGACLLISKDKFTQIGGFDKELPIAYNDVDLCFRLIDIGYYNVSLSSVDLIHHESASRGVDHLDIKKRDRLEKEKKLLYLKNPRFFQWDPFYNENLTGEKVNFDLGIIK